MMVKLFVVALSATLCFAYLDDVKRATGPHIERYCDFKDYDCIRGLVCPEKHRPENDAKAPECYRIPETIYEQSYFNVTIVDTSTDIWGLNRCYVSEFYRNKQTGNQVIALTCHNITITFDRRVIQHLPFMEDKEINVVISATFPDVTLSTVLQKSCGWNICRAHTATYYQLPVVKSYDQTGRDFLNSHINPPNVFSRAILLGVGRNMFHKYVDSVICHFGCQ